MKALKSDLELTRQWWTESSRIEELSDMGLMKIQRTRHFRVTTKTHQNSETCTLIEMIRGLKTEKTNPLLSDTWVVPLTHTAMNILI